jgi:hypothetical protein
MTSIRGKTAVVIGASSGVGRATVKALIAEEAHVYCHRTRRRSARRSARRSGDARANAASRCDRCVGRGALAARVPAGIRRPCSRRSPAHGTTRRADLGILFRAVERRHASGVFICSRVRSPCRYHRVARSSSCRAARPSTDRPLSGGYAGAKRMQWLLANYAQQLSDKKKLGIRFLAVVPHQLIEGTEIGNGAAAAYGASQGISGAEFMKRFKVPLDADKVGAAIVGALRGDVAQGVTAIEVTGQGRGAARLTMQDDTLALLPAMAEARGPLHATR